MLFSKAGSCTSYCTCNSVYGLFLTDDALMKSLFKIVELLLPNTDLELAISITGMVRAALIMIFTLILLRAMRDIGRELEVKGLSLRCRTMMIWTVVLYTARIIFSSASLTNLLPPIVTLILYIVVIIGEIAVVVLNLAIIYTCYMYICLPSDLKPKGEKPSRFAFVNEYRRRREEREAREREERRKQLAEKRRLAEASGKGTKKKK